MARIRKENPTRILIIKTATEMFFEYGFSKTTAAALSRKAGISTGNLTFHFPTKEHVLDVLVKMMCDFRRHVMNDVTDEGNSSLLAYCLELATMVAISDENENMRDFYLSSYSHPMTLDNIRLNDVEKIKQVFGDYCAGWEDARFFEAECIVSGIEYATIMNTAHSADLPMRIEGALEAIMLLFGIPEVTRKTKIAKVLSMDYREIGRRLLEDFKRFTEEENERAVEEMLVAYNLKRE
jgi:AcrR family transcriptional regulator